MFSFLLGTITAIVSIIAIRVLGKGNQQLWYSLVLAGIAFLYVGYTWSDYLQLAITAAQAVLFLLFAVQGMRSIVVLGAGYFLHGAWDVIYNYFVTADHIPPHYDIFCGTIDVLMGAYILIFLKRLPATA